MLNQYNKMYEQSSIENSHLAINIYILTYINAYINTYKCNVLMGIAQVQGSSPLNEIRQLPIYLYINILHIMSSRHTFYICIHTECMLDTIHQIVIQF